MMMAFNSELLEESGTAHIDLSGRLSIPVSENNGLSLDKLYNAGYWVKSNECK